MFCKMSQMFGADEAALLEDIIDFKVVPSLKQEFVNEKNDLHIAVMGDKSTGSGAPPLTAREHKTLRWYVVMRIWILGYESCRERIPGPVDEQAVGWTSAQKVCGTLLEKKEPFCYNRHRLVMVRFCVKNCSVNIP